MTAELILQKIQERKSNCMKDYKDFYELENASFEALYPIAIRLDELDQIIEIIKSCIAAGEDDGK